MRTILAAILLFLPLVALSGQAEPPLDMQQLVQEANEDAALEAAKHDGVMAVLAYYLDRILEPIVELLASPTLWHAVLAILGAGLAAVFVLEWLKRFAELWPFVLIFEGKHWLLKVRLAASLISGALAVVIGPDGLRLGVVVFVIGAAASPTLYDLCYKLWPAATDRLMALVRGDRPAGG